MLLDRIQKPNDIKNFSEEELPALADEIREFLIDKVSVTGGHLASNLGVVELTMALHLEFDLPADKIIWDVGHQSYTHKLLTGRREGFDTLREFGGMSGFPKRKESSCDAFDTGHSSTSISAGLGIAKARDLKGDCGFVISVIGDGSMTGGMAYEALNNAAQMKKNFIIVLNDNNMSIGMNVGGMSKYLNGIRTADVYTNLKKYIYDRLEQLPGGGYVIDTLRRTKSSIKQLFIPGMLFEDLGITYLGPVDGHSVHDLTEAFENAKKVNGAVLVHVVTVKGKGYAPAEQNPIKFHGIGPFNKDNGETLPSGKLSYSEVFGRALTVIADSNERVAALCAAMPDGTGLRTFASKYPSRFFDVGIAEAHCVTFAAGLASEGMIPVVAVYSSFLQRAYDQIVHDVCIQNLHVVFAIDRAGLVGNDGETHQGLFDLSYLSIIPGMTVMAPKNQWELIDMLQFAIDFSGPIAIRYPRGTAYDGFQDVRMPVTFAKGEYIYEEEEIALIAVGSMVKWADRIRQRLKELGYGCSLINARFIKPIDEQLIRDAAKHHKLFVTLEENVLAGGFCQRVEHMVIEERLGVDLMTVTLPDEYIEHGDFKSLKKELNMDEDTIAAKIITRFIGD